ncbi:MAG: L,D-transpeptidase family protein [Pseudomonadota bacterium]|nr:L,D-transpeptidase family protein [Pseudomonadota bacterium]
MTKYLLLAAASLAVAGCQSQQPANPDTEQALSEWRVDPAKVDANDLRQAVKDADARRFYEATGWKAAWTQDKADALLRALGEAPRHALEQKMFLPAGAPDDASQIEAALTAAAVGYANALARGRVDPTKVREVYTVPRPKTDVVKGLQVAVSENRLPELFRALAPQTAEYRALSEAYLRYRKEAASNAGPTIGDGEPLEVGKSDPRVAPLAEALRTNGYLPDDDRREQSGGDQQQGEAPPQTYTPEIAAAVKRMQADYGIDTDGVVGEDTLQVLNTGPKARARQLAVNMERMRWLERTPPQTRIDVNTAAAFLDYWREGQRRDRRRVVVGQPEWETPQLGSPMYRLVANPTWTIPKSIEEDEIAEKGPGYLAANNMVRKGGFIVQQPGPKNALGQVKFDMLNEEAIYLHDTPAKALFQESQRQRSHGCVRVDDALGFAQVIARDEGVLPEFVKAMQTGDETFVKLPKQIPVRLLYHTAFVDDSGRVRFRADPYGWDDDLAVALGLAQRARRVLQNQHGDVGP